MAGYQPRHDTDPVWFNGTQVNSLTVASAQTGVRITAVYGWDERPDVRDVRELRSGQDGEYADNLYLGGRTITLEGEVYGSSWVNLQARKRTLAALFVPSSDEVLLKIPDPATVSPTGVYASTGMTGYERVMCRVVEAIQFGDTLDPMCQVFQVILRASDPRVYSDTVTSTDSGTTGTAARTVTVDQGGTYETPPTLTVTGPTASTWSVAEPSSGLQLDVSGLTLAASETATLGVIDRTFTFSATYQSARLKSLFPPVGIWMLNEAAGVTADNAEGTSARDGTYTGGYSLNQSSFASGIASVDVNGSTGYVSIPYVAALHPASATFEGWFYFDSTSGTQTIVDGITSNRGLRFEWSGTQFVGTWGTGAGTASKSVTPYVTVATATWYRVVALYDATASIYAFEVRDTAGTLVAGGNTPAITYSAATSGGHRLGSSLAGTNFFNGRLSACAVYSTPNAVVTGALNAIVNDFPLSNGEATNAYTYLSASTARWASLGTGSSTYTLNSSGLNTGSKLTVAYRDARS